MYFNFLGSPLLFNNVTSEANLWSDNFNEKSLGPHPDQFEMMIILYICDAISGTNKATKIKPALILHFINSVKVQLKPQCFHYQP